MNKQPKLPRYIIMSVIVLALWATAAFTYSTIQGPFEASVAVGQLTDDAATYAVSQKVASGVISKIINLSGFGLLGLLWAIFGFRYYRFSQNTHSSETTVASIAVLTLLMASSTIGCGPADFDDYEDIEANETAFVVPMEGASLGDQGQFMSEEYLRENKVASKRVHIPLRKMDTGRWYGQHKWVRTLQVIRVNRTPVTREWVKADTKGTGASDEAIDVESRDSIGFGVGVNITASIIESDAAKFLYHYANKPLDQVVDQNVRGFIQGILSEEFGVRNLETQVVVEDEAGNVTEILYESCKSDKKVIFDKAVDATIEHFAAFGITINSMGMAAGLTYDDPEIQKAIDDVYKTEMDIQQASREQEAQLIRNATDEARAITERKVAEEFARAQNAAEAKIELEIQSKKADAMVIAAEKWNGETPDNVLPQGSQFLFGLDTSTQ